MSIGTPGQSPDELDELAGEYVLGTLPAQQRSEVQRRMLDDLALRAAVDAWEQRLLELNELAEPQAPSALLWRRIERTVDELARRGRAEKVSVTWWNRLPLWRGVAAAGLLASTVLAALLLTRGVAVDVPNYMVVLVAPQSQSPGWVIQASDSRAIQLIPLGGFQVPADKTLQFWTKGEDWQGPVSLGLVEPGQTLSLSLDELPPLEPNQLFELTLEPPSGSPTGKPTGPIQFIGRAVKVL